MLAIVSHDAGGAEVLSSYVRRNRVDCLVVLEGPARAVFARKLIWVNEATLDDAIDRASLVLCGTSWQSDLEYRAIRKARNAGRRTVAFLDHWMNYRQRFERNGTACLPDEIWVGDEPGVEIARRVFVDVPITHVPNPYFADIAEELREATSQFTRSGETTRVLYLCEPTGEHGRTRFGNERHWGYTEFEALRYFLDHREALGLSAARVVLRPHPAEATGKYDALVREQGAGIVLSAGGPLVDDIVASDIVVGCNSAAMVVALLANKRVLCSIPPGGAPCELPHGGIESLQRLLVAEAAERLG